MNETDYWIQLDKALKADREFSGLSQKKRDGTATLEEVQKYQYHAAQIEAEFLSKHLSEPGKGENSERCYELMKRRYQKVNQALSEAQEKLDEQSGLKIKAQKAKFPAERARQIANSLEDTTVPVETIQRRAKNAVANIANSFCDDYVQKNAEFKSNAGIPCYITRTTTGKCCAWCTQIAGRYEYGRHPADVFRRHDRCDCTVTYEEGRKRQNVWTKKTWSAPDIPDEALNFTPTVFNPEQARAIERQQLQYKGLTIPGKTDIIEPGNLFTVYGEYHSEMIRSFLSNAPEPLVKEVWNKFESELCSIDAHYSKGSCYSPNLNGVYLDIDLVSLGSRVLAPYEAVFHEYGHQIDYLIYRKKHPNGDKKTSFSETYQNGLLGQTIQKEAKKALTDFGNTLVSSGLYQTFPDRKTLEREFCDMINLKFSGNLQAVASISDMFESVMEFTVAPFGAGHKSNKPDYWKDNDVGKEAFAEMFSATISNYDSFATIQDFFHESYLIFLDILEAVI